MSTSKKKKTAEIDSPRSRGASRVNGSFAQATLDSLPAHICVLDEHGTIITTNESWNRFADENPPAPKQYGVGTNYLSLCDNASGRDAEGAQDVAAGIRSVIRGDVSSYQREYPCHAPQIKRWFTVHVTRFTDNDQTHIIVMHHDVTAYRQTWVAKVDSDDEFARVFDNNPAMMMLIDIQTRTILNANQAYCRIMGYTKEEVVNIPGKLGFAGADQDEVRAVLREVQEKDRVLGREFSATTREGRRVTGMLFIEPVDVHSRHYHTLTFIDITPYKQATQALEESESRYRGLFDHASIGIFHSLPEGRYLRVNPALAAMLGYDSSEEMISMVGNIDSQIYMDAQKRAELISRTLQADWVYAEVQYRRKDGSRLTANLSMRRVLNPDGTTDYLEGFIEDVTERKRAEDAIRNRNRMLTATHQVMLEIGTELHLPTLLSSIMQQAEAMLDADRGGGIYFYEPDADVLRLMYGTGINRGREGITVRKGEGVAGTVCETSRSLIVDNYTTWSKRTTVLVDDPPSTVMGVPLFLSGTVIGVLTLIANSHERTYGEADIQQAEMFAAQVSVAIQNAKLYQQAQDEIAERKQTEEKLRTSEERYRSILYNALDGFWRVDLEGHILEANSTWCKLTGYSAEEISHLSVSDFEAVASKEEILRKNQMIMKTGSDHFESRHRCKDGRIIDVDVTVVYLPLEGGQFFGFLRDITERKQIEATLREFEARFSTIFYSSPMPMALANLQDNILINVNQAWLDETGYEPEDIIGKSSYDLNLVVDPEVRRQFAEQMQENDKIDRFEVKLRKKSGEIVDVLMSADIINLAGESYVISMALDITDRKRSEEKLRSSEEHYRQAITAAGAVPYYRDYQTDTERYTFMGEGILKLTGYSAEEITPELFDALGEESIMRGSLSQLTMEEAGRLSETGEITHWACDYRIRTREGGTRWLSDSAVQVRDEHNRRVGVIGILQDITERKDAETDIQNARRALQDLNRDLEQRVQERTSALRYRESIYRTLFENSNDGIFLMNGKGETLDVNQHALNMLGYTREEYMSLPVDEILPIEKRAEGDLNLKIVLNGGYVPLFERTMIGKDGRIVDVEVNLSPVRDPDGNIILVQSVVRDISERKKVEERLRESRDQLGATNAALERALRAKDEFLASMSHELRTPLTSILGLSETLQMQTFGELTERQLRYVTTIERSGRHLLELINDILDLSKIDAGKLVLQLEPCHVEDICQASMQLTRGMAAQKKQKVHFSIEPSSIIISADERRFKQMLVNLLSNAIKFTPEGGELGVDVKGSEDEKSVLIAVWDKGIGISYEDMPRLFQPFVQLNGGLTRGQGGTGLGLALVREMARLHGGSVNVESDPGKGSRFTLTLPWLPVSAIGTWTPLTPVQEEVRVSSHASILLVEDTESVAMAVSDYLESRGYKVSVARNGTEGISLARKVRPHLILMDLQMPVMSGLEAAAYLRQDPQFQNTPIIALTALAMPGDRERSLQAGMNDYVSKPVKLKELVQTIESHLGLQSS